MIENKEHTLWVEKYRPIKLENYIGKMSGVYGVSRGEPPVGVTASVAMQFLDEQEPFKFKWNDDVTTWIHFASEKSRPF
jgi:hypothetical protein